MSKARLLALAAVLAGVLAATVGLQAQGDAGKPKYGHPHGHAFSDADRAGLKAAALAHVEASHKGDLLRAMHVASRPLFEAKGADQGRKHMAEVLVFDYTKGQAFRVEIDPQSGKITKQEDVQGLVLSSHEEREEGKKLAEADADLSKAVKAGGHIEGGFTVQPPKGLPATDVPHRYLEYHLTSPDHRALERMIVVDLSSKKIVVSKAPGGVQP